MSFFLFKIVALSVTLYVSDGRDYQGLYGFLDMPKERTLIEHLCGVGLNSTFARNI